LRNCIGPVQPWRNPNSPKWIFQYSGSLESVSVSSAVDRDLIMRMDSGQLVQRFYAEVWEQMSEAAAHEILHANIAFRGSLGVDCKGIGEFLGYVHSIHAAFANYRCAIDDLIASGPRAAARVTFSGTHRGVLLGVAATGRLIQWTGCALFTIVGVKIREIWVLGDVDGLKQQLGLCERERR
jgi:predicted ester cyclase